MTTANIFSFSDTWNDVSTTFNAIKVDVTDNASASDSALIDLQVGSASQFRVDKGGIITANGFLAEGNVDLQGNRLVLDADNDSYINVNGDDSVSIYISGTEVLKFDGAADDKLILDGVSFSPTGAVIGQALGYPSSPTTLEPYTPAGGGDLLAAANETVTGDYTFEGALDLSSITNKADLREDIGSIDVENVKADFSAVGDGVANDRLALFNAGTASAASGAYAYLPPGTYAVATSVTLPGDWLFADGAAIVPASGATVVFSGKVTANDESPIFDVSAGGSITLSSQYRMSAKWFGAVGDGSTDDFDALDAALASMPTGGSILYFPKGDYRTSDTLALTKTGQQLIGDHPRLVQIVCTDTSAPTITLANNTGRYVIRGIDVKHSGTAISGGDGIQTSGVIGRTTIENVYLTDNYNGFVGTSTDYSVIRDCIAANNVNDGFVLKNDPDDVQVQWNFRGKTLSQGNGRDGYRVESVTGGSAGQITLGTWQNCDTANNDGYGVRLLGASAVPIQDLRMIGCFIGTDNTGTIYLDTYGKQHQIVGSFIELSSSSGLYATANNSDLSVTGSVFSANEYYGIETLCDHVSIVGCTFINNGVDATRTDAERSAVYLGGSKCTVTGCTGFNNTAGNVQKYGVNIAESGNTVSSSNFEDCDVDDIVLSGTATLANTTLVGNTNPTSKSSNSLGFVLSLDGTAGNPAFSFSADTDTGFFRPTANVLAFAQGGAETARLTSAGNLVVGSSSGSGRITGVCAAGGTSLNLTDGTNSTFLVKHEAGNLLTYETLGGAKQRFVLGSTENARFDAGKFLVGKASGTYTIDVDGDINVDSGHVYRVAGTQVLGARVVNASLADTAALTAQTLTDNSGGSASDTIAAIGATYDQAEVANAIASLADEINKLRADNAAQKTAIDAALTLIRTHGLGTTS